MMMERHAPRSGQELHWLNAYSRGCGDTTTWTGSQWRCCIKLVVARNKCFCSQHQNKERIAKNRTNFPWLWDSQGISRTGECAVTHPTVRFQRVQFNVQCGTFRFRQSSVSTSLITVFCFHKQSNWLIQILNHQWISQLNESWNSRHILCLFHFSSFSIRIFFKHFFHFLYLGRRFF